MANVFIIIICMYGVSVCVHMYEGTYHYKCECQRPELQAGCVSVHFYFVFHAVSSLSP